MLTECNKTKIFNLSIGHFLSNLIRVIKFHKSFNRNEFKTITFGFYTFSLKFINKFLLLQYLEKLKLRTISK